MIEFIAKPNLCKLLFTCKPLSSSSAAATPRLLPFSSRYRSLVFVANLGSKGLFDRLKSSP